MQALTSGVEALDALIDGVRVGDNLVVLFSGDIPTAWLVERYVDAADPARLLVADTAGAGAKNARGEVLDWSDPALTAVQARAQLADADQRVGTDAMFVFDSLSVLAQRWGDGPALDLFLWACPRLFRRGSVALWVLRAEQHDDAFVRRLAAITQVLVTVRSVGDDEVHLEVVKADGRDVATTGRAIRAELRDGDLVGARPVEAERHRLAGHLRELRAGRGVGQAELARRVGISPSALSQAERGVRTVSAETLVRIWEALGVATVGDADRGYQVHRRSHEATAAVAAGVTGRRRFDDQALTVWELAFAPRASGRNSLFAVKATEAVLVQRGVLQVDLGGVTETLHEGDTLVAGTAAVTAWTNPADGPTEALWILDARG